MIVGNLPGGRYYKKSVMEMNSLLHEDYGKIIKIPSILGNKGMVLVYTSEEFEKVRGLWICEYSDDDKLSFRYSETKALGQFEKL
jgi:hypothetical protein